MLTLTLSLAAGLRGVAGLQNGMARTPAMGYSSWNDCASEVTEARIKATTLALIKTGLASKGYIHVNVDEGWFLGHDPNSRAMMEDRVKFPSGMKALGNFIHSQRTPEGVQMLYGLYTSRGTCQCGTEKYQANGTAGFVLHDALWMVEAGADYVKEDSCCGSQVHDEAFADYAAMRDALNATSKPVYFSLCGWYDWYAPQGDSLGNSWRIDDDGKNWGALSNAININVPLQKYARPGAWNDPDLLQATGVGSNDKATNPNGCFVKAEIQQSWEWYQTETQARAQFSMWAVMSAPLLISASIEQASAFMLETWGNEEVIYINQNFREGGPYQGARLAGTNVSYNITTKTGSGTNVWGKLLPKDEIALVFLSNEDRSLNVTCDEKCFKQLEMADPMFKPFSLASKYTVRELWAKQDQGPIGGGSPLELTAMVMSHGGVAVFKLTPTK